jgi:hypothetical protein
MYLPDDQGSVKDESSYDNGENETGDQAENGIRVWEGHNSQADVL